MNESGNERTARRTPVKGGLYRTPCCVVGKLTGSGYQVLKDKEETGEDNEVCHSITQQPTVLWRVSYNPPMGAILVLLYQACQQGLGLAWH